MRISNRPLFWHLSSRMLFLWKHSMILVIDNKIWSYSCRIEMRSIYIPPLNEPQFGTRPYRIPFQLFSPFLVYWVNSSHNNVVLKGFSWWRWHLYLPIFLIENVQRYKQFLFLQRNLVKIIRISENRKDAITHIPLTMHTYVCIDVYIFWYMAMET